MLSTCRVRVPAGCPLYAPEAPEAQGSRPRGRARVDTCAARVPAPSVPTPRAAQPDPWFLPPRLLGRGPSVSRAIRSRRGASRSRQGAGGSNPRISRVARPPEAPRSARCARPIPMVPGHRRRCGGLECAQGRPRRAARGGEPVDGQPAHACVREQPVRRHWGQPRPAALLRPASAGASAGRPPASASRGGGRLMMAPCLGRSAGVLPGWLDPAGYLDRLIALRDLALGDLAETSGRVNWLARPRRPRVATRFTLKKYMTDKHGMEGKQAARRAAPLQHLQHPYSTPIAPL